MRVLKVAITIVVSLLVVGAVVTAINPVEPKAVDYAPTYGQYVGTYTTFTYPEAEPTNGLVEITGMNIYMMAQGREIFSAKYTPREYSKYTSLKTDKGVFRLYGNTASMDAFVLESDGVKIIIVKTNS